MNQYFADTKVGITAQEQSIGERMQGVFVMYSNPFVCSCQKLIEAADVEANADATVYVISRWHQASVSVWLWQDLCGL